MWFDKRTSRGFRKKQKTYVLKSRLAFYISTYVLFICKDKVYTDFDVVSFSTKVYTDQLLL